MDITTIMVPMGRNEATPTELKHIGDLADQFGARILGVMARELTPPFYFEAGIVAADILEEDRQRITEGLAQAEKRFRGAFKGRSVSWTSSVDWPTDFALREARSADLIACFRRTTLPLEDIELGALVLKAGRPVLLLAETGIAATPRVLVTWKDTREARRAIRDALPILKRASSVRVVEIAEEDWSRSAAEAHLKDVTGWLAAHKIETTTACIQAAEDVPEQIDAVASEFAADLIVAGGYGHSRLGEWIFGGVTDHLIARSRRSVLLSH